MVGLEEGVNELEFALEFALGFFAFFGGYVLLLKTDKFHAIGMSFCLMICLMIVGVFGTSLAYKLIEHSTIPNELHQTLKDVTIHEHVVR